MKRIQGKQKTHSFQERLGKRTRGIIFLNALKGFLFTLAGVGIMVYLLFMVYFFARISSLPIPPQILGGVFFTLPFLTALIIIILQRRQIPRLTLLLEQHYPHLRDRLQTMAELSQKRGEWSAHPFSQILARGLENEMNLLMDRFGFGRAASPRKLLAPAVFLFALLVTGMVHAMVQPNFFAAGYRRMTEPLHGEEREGAVHDPGLPAFEIQVVPGHCEIEKGSNVLIQARVIGHQAKYVELYVKQNQESTWQIFPMNQTEENAFQFLLTHVTEPSRYRIKADYEESSTFQIRLFEALKIEKALWRIEFPRYMGLPEQRREGWREKMTVPRGTRLNLELTMNRPVKAGWIVAEPRKRFALKASSFPEQLETSIDASHDLTLRLEVQGAGGEPLLDVPSLWIQTLPDLPPYLEVLEPQEHNYVFPTEEVPFKISVNDDYRIRSVALVLHYQGTEKRLEWLPRGKSSDNIVLKPILNLERFKLRSRDIVFAYVEVRDDYPGKPAHIVRSPLLTFLIRDYVEEFKIKSPPPDMPSLRMLFEDILIGQEKITQETWDYLSLSTFEEPKGWEEGASTK